MNKIILNISGVLVGLLIPELISNPDTHILFYLLSLLFLFDVVGSILLTSILFLPKKRLKRITGEWLNHDKEEAKDVYTNAVIPSITYLTLSSFSMSMGFMYSQSFILGTITTITSVLGLLSLLNVEKTRSIMD